MPDGGGNGRYQSTVQKREEVYAALQDAASFHCLVEVLIDCEELIRKHKGIEWSGVRQQTHIVA